MPPQTFLGRRKSSHRSAFAVFGFWRFLYCLKSASSEIHPGQNGPVSPERRIRAQSVRLAAKNPMRGDIALPIFRRTTKKARGVADASRRNIDISRWEVDISRISALLRDPFFVAENRFCIYCFRNPYPKTALGRYDITRILALGRFSQRLTVAINLRITSPWLHRRMPHLGHFCVSRDRNLAVMRKKRPHPTEAGNGAARPVLLGESEIQLYGGVRFLFAKPPLYLV